MKHPVCAHSEGEILNTPWGSLTWFASAKIGNSNTMTFGRAVIPAHGRNPRHRHPNCDEILHVLRGRIRHSLGENSYELGPGDTISIPAGQWHHAESLNGAETEMVICFSSAHRETEFAPETAVG